MQKEYGHLEIEPGGYYSKLDMFFQAIHSI